LNLLDLFLRSTRTERQPSLSAQPLGELVSGKRIKLWYRPTRRSSASRDEYKRESNRGSTIVSTVLTHSRQYCRLLQQRLTKPESQQCAVADNAARKPHGSVRQRTFLAAFSAQNSSDSERVAGLIRLL